MNSDQLTKLETRIYAFSVNVFSFVKSLSEENKFRNDTKELLNAANRLYSSYLSVLELVEKGEKEPVFENSIKNAEECSSFLQKFELKKALLNEKVDLLIEANEIIRKLKSLE